jgi:hypothetical protein
MIASGILLALSLSGCPAGNQVINNLSPAGEGAVPDRSGPAGRAGGRSSHFRPEGLRPTRVAYRHLQRYRRLQPGVSGEGRHGHRMDHGVPDVAGEEASSAEPEVVTTPEEAA